jgi:galactose mutarotase-like enzyme
MIYTLENEFLKVGVKHIGAEICNIVSKTTQHEYMWQADPTIWGSSAPVLFPIIGSLKNQTYTLNGKTYSIPKHGFIRNNSNLKIITASSSLLEMSLVSSDETLDMFPFLFEFVISFQLHRSELTVSHSIKNLSKDTMPFSLGGHPAFNCPLQKQETYEDYYLEFEHIENAHSLLLSEEGLISNDTIPVLINSKKLPLTKEMFSNDALMFTQLKSKKVTLKNGFNNNSISLSYTDFSFLGIWAKPNAPFICIEPWNGITDFQDSNGDFKNKPGMVFLEPQKEYQAEYKIEIHENI